MMATMTEQTATPRVAIVKVSFVLLSLTIKIEDNSATTISARTVTVTDIPMIFLKFGAILLMNTNIAHQQAYDYNLTVKFS